MKKIIVFTAALVCLIMLFSVNISADEYSGVCGEDAQITWRLNTDLGFLQITGSGALPDYSKSGSRAAPWSKYAQYIKSATVNGLTEIGEYAFSGCYNMTAVSLPREISDYKKGLFYNCASLERITISKNVVSISPSAFYGCSKLSDITLEDGNAVYSLAGGCLVETSKALLVRGLPNGIVPDSVKTIGEYAFSGFLRLTGLTVPNTVEKIEYGAFSGCSALTEITLPFAGESRVSVEDVYNEENLSAQRGLRYIFGDGGIPAALKTVVISDSELIVVGAFTGCDKISNVVLPQGLRMIGDGAFAGCSELLKIELPSSLETIGAEAFFKCSKLAEINIPDSVTKIESGAFLLCGSIKTVTLGSGLKELGKGAFLNCVSFESLTVAEGNQVFLSDGECIISREDSRLIVGCRNSRIPSYVKIIGKGAFANCLGLTEIDLPIGLESIEDSAFEGCVGLLTVTIPSTVKSLGARAFAGCSGITHIEIPAGIEKYGDSVFAGCTSLSSENMTVAPYRESGGGCAACSSMSLPAVIICVFSLGAMAITKKFI